MEYIMIAIVMFFLGWKLGRKYQDFQDLMIARRVAKLVDQRETVSKERDQFERWERQDKRLRNIREDDNDDRSVSRTAGDGKNISNDAGSSETHEKRYSGIR
jgi:hypothetical protein